MCVYIYVYTHTHIYTHIYICIYTHTHIHTYIYIYIHTHTHTHTHTYPTASVLVGGHIIYTIYLFTFPSRSIFYIIKNQRAVLIKNDLSGR